MKIELEFYSIDNKYPEKGEYIIIIEANGNWTRSKIEWLSKKDIEWIHRWAYAPEIYLYEGE